MAATVVVGKDRFTSVDALAVARELRTLGRAHVDKAFDLGPDRLALTVRASGIAFPPSGWKAVARRH